MKRTWMAAIALASLGIMSSAEAGRITVTNSAAFIARVKWKVADSESGWTNLTVGKSMVRDFPNDYPNVEVRIEYFDGARWYKGACASNSFPASKTVNIEMTGTTFQSRCKVI